MNHFPESQNKMPEIRGIIWKLFRIENANALKMKMKVKYRKS